MSSINPNSSERTGSIPLSISEEVKLDFKLSLQAFRNNVKAFMGTELFAFLFFVVGMLISVLITLIYLKVKVEEIAEPLVILMLLPGFLISIWLFQAMLTCQYGLAFDIMSSGDMFAEFKGSFSYFKRFWWQYPLLSLIFTLSGFFTQFDLPIKFFITEVNVQIMLYTPLTYCLTVLFIEIFPSLTSSSNLKASFKENFLILKQNPKRLLATWGIFYIIFQFIPSIVIFIISLLSNLLFEELITIIIFITLIIVMLFWMFVIGYPVMTLIATRIYNSTKESGNNKRME
ncbi:hypothetical protein NEF87_000679 [Candidatus Lokiarchaeum ossiferum]|uniref:Glycerophosphoryl diester phosphodiesterase membrane domain-containing protein n=1 Tax=Candidatus Lokiarchaeum ossiferum TaxID=2951803 RepID=A0ABY6HLK5_9ARCH|nr:hypothetical protein NEF87_000679 [Candidatus Lokiarchaeum sp. B-35]